MAEISKEEYESKSIKDMLIISIVGLIIFLALVIYGFKLILGDLI